MGSLMKAAMLLLAVAVARAHDEGHGPKLKDVPPHGGVVAAVIEAKDADKGAKAALLYKAELLRSEDGTVRVYLYDKNLKPLDLSGFAKTAKAAVETVKKKKVSKAPFELKLDGEVFMGLAPKPARKPFNIDVTLQEGKRALLAAFDNLD